MTTLHDRLAELADDAENSSDVASARDLWARGRVYTRRRRVGTFLIVGVAAVLIGSVVGLVLTQATPLDPAAETQDAGLPSRMTDVSSTLTGTDDGGPLGQLSILTRAERKTATGTGDPALAGVSAATGEYRFIDLEGMVGTDAVLSPDGTGIAYWFDASIGGEQAPADLNPAGGVAVYDTVSGRTQRQPVLSKHGLGPEGLWWARADRVVAQFDSLQPAELNGRTTWGVRIDEPLLVWDVSSDETTRADHPKPMEQMVGPDLVLGIGGSEDRFGLDVRRLTTGKVVSTVDSSAVLDQSPVIDDTLTRLAAVNGEQPGELVVGDIDLASRVTGQDLSRVPGPKVNRELLGWVDDRHVASVQAAGDGRPPALAKVNVDLGTSEVLIADFRPQSQVATDLLDRPTIDRPMPPDSGGIRVVSSLLSAILLGCGAAVIWWRRHVRP